MNNIGKSSLAGKLLLAALFATSFAYVEATVVVYLRELIYPEGFSFPLKDIPPRLIAIELLRELATMIMLLAVALIIARRAWERFAYFIFAFGIWDIFYYVWLKVTIDWPASITEWDILFLIPLPWIGPVLAPALISALLIVVGYLVARLTNCGGNFRPPLLAWILATLATALILYSFMRDTDATLRFRMPQPYSYQSLIAGLLLYVIGFIVAYRSAARSLPAEHQS